jgi:hypothetical protein
MYFNDKKRGGILIMSSIEIQNKTKSVEHPMTISRGDRESRFYIEDDKDKKILALADDISRQYFAATQMEQLNEQTNQFHQQFLNEYVYLSTLVDEWVQKHIDQIVKDKTQLAVRGTVTSSGTVHIRFVVTKKTVVDWLNDPLDNELTEFEEKLSVDPSIKIIQLNSILVPNSKD